MRDWPRGYTVWSDYHDEAPEDLNNRLMAEQVNTMDEAKQELAERLDRIADALESIVHLIESRTAELGRAIININQKHEGTTNE